MSSSIFDGDQVSCIVIRQCELEYLEFGRVMVPVPNTTLAFFL